MLYKDGPAPSRPAASGGAYSPPQGYRPQPEQPPQMPPQMPPQIPPQPAAGQNPSYPYGPGYPGQSGSPGYPGQSAVPGQVIGQAPPQPVTERNVGYPYGPGYPGQSAVPGYAGQSAVPGYAGQYINQPVGPGQNQPGGGKSKLPVFIGIGAGAAAVIVAVIIGVFVWMGGDREGTAEHSDSPGQSAAPTYSFVPLPTEEPTPSDEPSQDTVTGVTDDGFRYEIVDQNHAVLTGYEGAYEIKQMPDYVENVPVTAIADSAFAGAAIDEYVDLPQELETIGAGAFQGCSDLLYVIAYSDVTAESTSFSGCDNLWFVAVLGTGISGWNLPRGVSLYYIGMETGIGRLADAGVYNGMLIGWTEDDTYMLMDVQPGVTSIDLDEVDWICPGALNNLGYGADIELGSETLYPYDVFSNSYSWYAPDGTLSDVWLLSCITAWGVNSARPSGAARMEPDLELIQAAATRAEEYGELHDINTRPNGSGWSSVLADLNISYRTATGSAGYNYSDYQAMWDDAAEYMVEQYASAIAQGDFSGQYYNRVGVAVAQQPDGQYAWWGFVTIS